MSRRLKIALALPDFEPWGLASFLNGITDYARANDWVLTHCPADPESSRDCPLKWSSMANWQMDGLIIALTESSHLKKLRHLKVPTVNIAGDTLMESRVPAVAPHSRMIGRLAAEHLISLGIRNLAYHGVEGRFYSNLRWQGFKEMAKEAGLNAVKFCVAHTIRDALWNERHDQLRKWLSKLPRPVGLFAVHDYRALIAMSACRDIGLRVPEDVAIIGADNNLMVCNFSVPTLSSIAIDGYRLGQEAAKLLRLLLEGQSPPTHAILVNPNGVIQRKSSEVLHLADEISRKAVLFMQTNYAKQFKIGSISDALCISRRTLELRFRKAMKSSPADFLSKLRVQKAVALLKDESKWSLERIARECGFINGANLRAAFQRNLNATPHDYRVSKL